MIFWGLSGEAQNPGVRLREGNVAPFWPGGETTEGGKVDSMQRSNVESRTPGHISSYQGRNVLDNLKQEARGYEATIYIGSMLLRRQSSQPGGTPTRGGPADYSL